MSKAASASLRLRQRVDQHHADLRHGRDDQLGDPLVALHNNRHLAQVDQDHPNLTTVVRVDGARGVQNRQSMFEREPRAWANLPLESMGDLKRKPGRDQQSIARKEGGRRVERGPKIEPRRRRRGVGGRFDRVITGPTGEAHDAQ